MLVFRKKKIKTSFLFLYFHLFEKGLTRLLLGDSLFAVDLVKLLGNCTIIIIITIANNYYGISVPDSACGGELVEWLPGGCDPEDTIYSHYSTPICNRKGTVIYFAFFIFCLSFLTLFLFCLQLVSFRAIFFGPQGGEGVFI